MSLGQRVIESILGFIINNSFWIVVFSFMCIMCVDYYNKFLRINRKTDNVNLIGRYLFVRMVRRYGRPKV